MMRIRIFILSIVCLSFFSCRKLNEKEIYGVYQIDKHILVDTGAETKPQLLILKKNQQFELIVYKGDEIKGSWNIVSSGYHKSSNGQMETHAAVRFRFREKVITGTLKGNIFYFSTPNIFHPETFKSVLYAKTSQDPNE